MNNMSEVKTVKITNCGCPFTEGQVWNVNGFTGWTTEKIRKHLNLPESTEFIDTEEKEIEGGIAIGFYGFCG